MQRAAFILLSLIMASVSMSAQPLPHVVGSFASSFYVSPEGQLWAWGNNSGNQLGVPQASAQYLPVKGMDHVQALASGEGHTLFLKSDGTLWVAGRNGNGQLGTGTGVGDRPPFQQVMIP